MSTIVLRATKGTPLTNTEVDANFSNLNTDKLQLGGTYSTGTANGVAYLNGSKVLTTGSALTFDGANLGLGVTPSAWGSGFKGLDIGPVAGFASESTTTDVVRNAVYTTAWTYKTTSVATLYRQNSSGVHAWYNAPSGTAGAAITFTQAMTLDANGNLQIGTTNAGVGGLGISPDKTINFAESATTAYSTIFRQASNATLTLNFGYTRSSTAGGWASSVGTSVARSSIRIGAGELYFYTNAASTVAVGTDITPTERMRLDSAGNLGLGVTPSAWSTSGATTKVLEMYNGGPNGSLAGFSDGSFQLSTNAYYGAGAWAYKTTDAAANYFQQTGKHVWRNATSGTAGSALTWTTTMTLDANGNLGVGTSSPSVPLHVSKGAAGDEVARFTNAGGFGLRIIPQIGGSGSVTALRVAGGESMSFETNSTERMRLDSAGNLGLGVTPSAWGANYRALQMGTNGRAAFWEANGATAISYNEYHNGTNDIYVATTGAARYRQNGTGHFWETAPSGTAGTAITFTQAMTLNASGNLGVGISSPSARLEVFSTTDNTEYFRAGTSDTTRSLRFSSFTVGGTNSLGHLINAPGASGVNGVLAFATNSTERLRIDSSGNVQVQAGAIVPWAPAPAAISAAATLTNANIQGQIINTTGTTYTVTMPLGTTMETLVPWAAVNLGYDFYVINTASGTITMAVNTGVTAVGGLTIATGTSAQFRIRRTAANTFVLYRLG